jgi:WD40 repeat protein
MSDTELIGNITSKRKICLINIIIDFLPIVLSKIISEYDYYFEGKLCTLVENCDSINCINELYDGRIISGSDDGIIKIWNQHNGKCELTILAAVCSIKCCAVLSDRQIICCSFNRKSKWWKLQLFDLIKRKSQIRLDLYCLECIGVLGDGPSGCFDKRIIIAQFATLKIWNPQTEKYEFTMEGHMDLITCVIVLPNGRLVSGSCDKTLRVWNVQTGKQSNPKGNCELILRGHTDRINSIASLSDNQIVSGSNDKTIRIWDLTKGECINILKGHCGRINSVAVLPDKRIVSVSSDATLKIWSFQDGTFYNCDISLRDFYPLISRMIVLSDGRIVCASDDNTIKIWY